MKVFKWADDGGPNSGVRGLFFVEIKPAFSIVLLQFEKGTREAFHSHAFNAVTLWLKGRVREHHLDGRIRDFRAGCLKYTSRDTFHKVEALETVWAFSVRGPWVNTWHEFRAGRFITLTHGRREVL